MLSLDNEAVSRALRTHSKALTNSPSANNVALINQITAMCPVMSDLLWLHESQSVALLAF